MTTAGRLHGQSAIAFSGKSFQSGIKDRPVGRKILSSGTKDVPPGRKTFQSGTKDLPPGRKTFQSGTKQEPLGSVRSECGFGVDLRYSPRKRPEKSGRL